MFRLMLAMGALLVVAPVAVEAQEQDTAPAPRSARQQVEERFAQVNDRAERLRFLEADVGQILDLSAEDVEHFPADHPERIRWDKAMKVIDHHIRSAHAAKSYEDASVALLRAADVANKLAL